MPLEQMGGSVDNTADLYALGATIVHMPARKHPSELMTEAYELDVAQLQLEDGFSAFLKKLTARSPCTGPFLVGGTETYFFAGAVSVFGAMALRACRHLPADRLGPRPVSILRAQEQMLEWPLPVLRGRGADALPLASGHDH
jgi:hypothetical protein